MQRFLNAVDKTPSGPAPACSPSFPPPRWPRTAPARILFCSMYNLCMCDPQASRWLSGKKSPAKQETQARSLCPGDPLEEDTATRSSTLAWRIPWTGEPGGLQSTGSQSQTRLAGKEQPAQPQPPSPSTSAPSHLSLKNTFPSLQSQLRHLGLREPPFHDLPQLQR